MKNTSPRELAKMLHIHPARALESVIKAQLISAVLKAVRKKGVTHAQIASRSGVPRSAVTGILNGSLQKVSLDRVLRIVDAVGLTADVKVREAA